MLLYLADKVFKQCHREVCWNTCKLVLSLNSSSGPQNYLQAGSYNIRGAAARLLLSFKDKADHRPGTLLVIDDKCGTTEIINVPVETLCTDCHRTSEVGDSSLYVPELFTFSCIVKTQTLHVDE